MNSRIPHLFAVLFASFASAAEPSVPAPLSIPLSQLGAEVQKQHSGNHGLSITPAKDAAKLKAAIQDLEGEATSGGLWLTSVADEDQGKPNRFRVMATALSRSPTSASLSLTTHGRVHSTQDTAMWIRPGLIEEYTVSTDGVCQDFVIPERLLGAHGPLALDLSLTGARAAPATYGAQLTITATGRELAYSRLKVTDATGREIPAEMQVPAPERLRVVVQDTAAVYPLRIDPTFSDADWVGIGGFTGANHDVWALAVDGTGNLYIGGSFSAVGTIAASNIAKWNGSTWSALGAGANAEVHALVVNGSDLYVGGYFTKAGGINASRVAKWNGTAWSALGSGTNSDVAALAMSGGNLYAGGNFTTAGGGSASRIAKWNGTGWSPLGSGLGGVSFPWVYSIVGSGSDLYVGGIFTTAGGSSANYVARWDGTAWSALGSGMSGAAPYVHALVISGSDLYAGGEFTSAGGNGRPGIARWNGTSWQSVVGSGGSFSSVNSLVVNGSDLYAAGYFEDAGGNSSRNIARWNGTTWSAMGAGTLGGSSGSLVYAMVVSGGDLFAGGEFTMVDGVAASCVARWSGSGWSALSPGLGNSSYVYVNALAVSNGDLYVGGDFILAGSGASASNVAKWNGSSWSALGSGTDAPVYALAMSGGDLYAGGQFTMAGGVSANHVAKWNGSTWSALGAGVNDPQSPNNTYVYALAVRGSDLYAGGNFNTAGGSSAKCIARWNGSAWSALGSGMTTNFSSSYSPTVYALAVNGGDLYAGGRFDAAGGVSAGHIAKWNGSMWTSLSQGMNGAVHALALSGGNLYAGGDFTSTANGGVGAPYIARWNGSAWSALGSGMNTSVYALTVSGGALYAGGSFPAAGGVAASCIAKWNGTAWTPLGSGVTSAYTANCAVLALVSGGGSLYAGGSFTAAGVSAAPYLAGAAIGAYDPSVILDSPSEIGLAKATLNGIVNPNGIAITAQFEYGLTTSYGSTAAVTLSPSNGTTAQNVSAALTGLASSTTYHYRLTFITNVGTSSTGDGTFTTPPSQQEWWRQQYFGTTGNTGNAADLADPDGDGIPNLLEWACLQDPTKPGTLSLTAFASTSGDGTSLTFIYTRSNQALQAGTVFTVEWSDTLAAGTWSSTGVMESIVVDLGTSQVVLASTPVSTSGRHFVRLSVTPP